MAISGSLLDVKFIEILKIVGKRTGRLWIYNFDTNVFQEWFVHEQHIRALRVNRVSQTTPDDIHRAAVTLNGDSTSQYIFYALELERLPLEISLPIAGVAVRLLTENLDFEHYRDQLPNPDTRFETAHENSFLLNGELHEFWERCRSELPQQFSAGDAAAHFGIPVDEAQFNFYKLRASGVLKPARIMTANRPLKLRDLSKSAPPVAAPPAETQLPAPAASERRTLVQRMLNALNFNKN